MIHSQDATACDNIQFSINGLKLNFLEHYLDKHNIYRLPSFSLPSSAMTPVGKILRTIIPIFPIEVSFPPTIVKPSPLPPLPFWTVIVEGGRYLGDGLLPLLVILLGVIGGLSFRFEVLNFWKYTGISHINPLLHNNAFWRLWNITFSKILWKMEQMHNIFKVFKT